jgi:putative bacteriophage protein|nr:MAG TPA: tail sheath protein [Caudoviricetes sp.]
MPTKPLQLNEVVNFVVNLAQRSAQRKAFNIMLLVGKNTVIPKEERVRTYTTLEAMLADGFTTNDRLYKAAALIKAQSRSPVKFCIGTQDANETMLQAITACREAHYDWYVVVPCAELTVQQHLDNMAYTNACTPDTVYAFTSKAAEDLQGGDGSIFKKAKDLKYRRTIGIYSTKHDDAVAGIMAYAMGMMTGTINSAFTLKFKGIAGVTTENSEAAIAVSAVDKLKKQNGNIYVNRGFYYDMFEEGTMADGTFFDEIIYLDKLKNDCQLALMDLFVQNAKIAQTEGGMTRIHNALNGVLKDYQRIGYLETGVWRGDTILGLKYGDTVNNGYLVQSEPIAEQNQADRENRIAPPIYIALKLAGAIHSAVVQIDVNR